ncbi:MAG: DUF1214 domain-containing protein [Spongiibacter sp.]|nr:DUF1214 domain-containing protein [Spongiibacter sp.]
MTNTILAAWQNTPAVSGHTPEIWRALGQAISELEGIVWADPRVTDDLTRAEGVRYLTRLIAGAIPMTIECWDVEYPTLFKFLSSRIQYGLPAADALYQWAPVHGDYVYRIKGRRGSAHMLDIETRVGHFAHIGDWQIYDRCGDFAVDDDGTIEIVLSHREQPGNWVKIPQGYGDIIFRQYFYDWATESPAEVIISRDHARYPAPPCTAESLALRSRLLLDWLRNLPGFFAEQVKSYYANPGNTMVFDEVSIGWAELRYGKMAYECAEDEALIIEVVPPKAEYWSVQLYSHYWDARDWALRQTSINGHQAVLDSEGVFRAVLSHRDPGVDNWLDLAGHVTGLLSARYFRAKTVPVPSVKRVKLADIAEYFSEHERSISAEQRSEQLRRRHESVIRRGCL